MIKILILCLAFFVIGVNVHAQESGILKSDDVLEKYIDRVSQRKCDSNPLTSYYKCSCKLSIHFPFFIKENKSPGLKKINQYIKSYIDEHRTKVGECKADGNDFGESRLSYVILYQDKKYISIGIEKFFCCDDYGETHSYKIFNFDQVTGNTVEISDFIDPSNFSDVDKYIIKDVKVYVENLPKDFKILTSIRNVNGSSKVSLVDIYAQYYFTENGIAMKVRPDVLGSNIIDVKIPSNLVKLRYYPSAVTEEELNDNIGDVLKNEKIIDEQ